MRPEFAAASRRRTCPRLTQAHRRGTARESSRVRSPLGQKSPRAGPPSRDVASSPDSKRMFVSVGSGSNDADKMPRRGAAEIAAWEAGHGLGAAWGRETNRAAVLVFDPDGKNGRIFASGIRNC